jgi:hypothetical protein
MSEHTTAYPSDAGATTYLLTVRGIMAPQSVEETRALHNRTAGNEAGVAAAKSLGDLSHNVYIGHHKDTSDVLFLDLWNSLSGMGMFFSDPQVQAGGAALFARRETPVWAPAPDFGSFHLATPAGRAVGGVGLLRVRVDSLETAAKAFREYAAKTINTARRAGLISHTVWMRVPDPGQPPVAEVIGVDTWLDADDADRHYDKEIGFDLLGPVFAGEPDASVWRVAPGEWVEW